MPCLMPRFESHRIRMLGPAGIEMAEVTIKGSSVLYAKLDPNLTYIGHNRHSSILQNSYYIANFINAILYGVELSLYFMVVQRLLALGNRRTSMDKFMMMFSTVLLILNTIFWTTQVYFGQRMWINNPDYPDGIDGYWQGNSSVWYQTWGTTACVASNLMSDALLIYRCFVVWDSRRVTIVPSLLWVASLVFAVGLLYGSGRPNGNYFAGFAAMSVTAYTASTFAFNVVVTGLICGRLVYIQHYMQSYYGADRQLYAGAVAIVVESALPFTLFNLAYLVAFAVGTDVASAFSFFAMFTCISPLLITLRVLSRRAWTRTSKTRLPESMATITYVGPTHVTPADCGTPSYTSEMRTMSETPLKHLTDPV